MAAILDFWRPSWIDNGDFLTLYSTDANDHLYKFWCFYHKVNDRDGLFLHQLITLIWIIIIVTRSTVITSMFNGIKIVFRITFKKKQLTDFISRISTCRLFTQTWRSISHCDGFVYKVISIKFNNNVLQCWQVNRQEEMY